MSETATTSATALAKGGNPFKGFFDRKCDKDENILTIFKSPRIWGAVAGELVGTMLLVLLGDGACMNINLNKSGQKGGGMKVAALILGEDTAQAAEEAFCYGAEIAYTIDSPLLKTYSTDAYTKAVCQAAEAYQPEIFLLGGTLLGRDLAPRVAARLHRCRRQFARQPGRRWPRCVRVL